jgi:hypothetical protein
MPKNDEITAKICIFSDQDLRNWSYAISVIASGVEYQHFKSEPKFSDSQEAEEAAWLKAGELISKVRKKLDSPDYSFELSESDFAQGPK